MRHQPKTALLISLLCSAFLCGAALAESTGDDKDPAPAPRQTPDTMHPQAGGDADPALASHPSAPADPFFGSYLSGRFAESQGDTDNGIQFLRESLRRDPDNKETLASLYRMLILSGHIDEALPLARKLTGVHVVEDGSEFSPEILQTVQDGKDGRYAEAASRLALIPKAGFNNLLVPLLEAWLKLGQNQVKTPLEAHDIMPEARLLLPHIHLNAAFINDLAGFDQAAEKQYQAAIRDSRIEPFRAVQALANFYERKGETDKRHALLEDYVKEHGDSFLASELLGAIPGHPRPLVASADEGIAEVLYTMANIFHGVRTPSDEIAILHLAIYVRPDFPAAQFLLASAYELNQDYRPAIDTYRLIDPKSPFYARGRIRAVYDESELGDKAQALKDVDEVARDMPREVDPLLAKGDILRSEGELDDAAAAYSEGIARAGKLRRQHWIMFYSRGVCYQQMNQWDKAQADMEMALKLSPGEPEALNFLGYSWLTMNRNLPRARKMIEDAYDARPEDAAIIDSMGYSLYVSGDFASAVEYFEQALERTPDDPSVNEHLGDTYWQLGRKTEARYQWQRALDDNPDDDTRHGLQTRLTKGLRLFHALALPPSDARPQDNVPEEE